MAACICVGAILIIIWLYSIGWISCDLHVTPLQGPRGAPGDPGPAGDGGARVSCVINL